VRSFGIIVLLLLAAPLHARPAACPPDHMALSPPVLRLWRDIPLGSPVYMLDDGIDARDWLERSDIWLVNVQGGFWRMRIEEGYTMFQISPYRARKLPHCPHPRRYQSIVIKVPGELSVAGLLAAIRDRNPAVTLDSYHVSGDEELEMLRTSRREHP